MDNQLKHRVIDKILSIKNEKLLFAIDQLLESAINQEEIIPLTKEQKWMLEMSENDLANGDTIKQEDLDEEDLAWLSDQ